MNDPALYEDFNEKIEEIKEVVDTINDGDDTQRLNSAIELHGYVTELMHIAEQLQ